MKKPAITNDVFLYILPAFNSFSFLIQWPLMALVKISFYTSFRCFFELFIIDFKTADLAISRKLFVEGRHVLFHQSF